MTRTKGSMSYVASYKSMYTILKRTHTVRGSSFNTMSFVTDSNVYHIGESEYTICNSSTEQIRGIAEHRHRIFTRVERQDHIQFIPVNIIYTIFMTSKSSKTTMEYDRHSYNQSLWCKQYNICICGVTISDNHRPSVNCT